ncbi:MAG: S1-like domain-containing RNA-binding protein [Bacteroidota bacterium]
MIALGKYAELEVLRITEPGVYLDGGPLGDLLLPQREVPEDLEIGQDLRVFLYCDSDDRPIATTIQPLAEAGHFALLQVKDVNHYGAFLDWGLAKDLFVPFREQHRAMQVGESVLVYVYVDEDTDRLVASSRLNRFVEKENQDLERGQAVEILVAEVLERAFRVIVNDRYWGRLYRNEVFQALAIGDRLPAYVKKIREDRLLDISLQEQGFNQIPKSAELILAQLRAQSGFLPLTDKSSPEEIYDALQMSKKVFKKSLGLLYKRRIVRLEKDGVRLLS